MTDKSVRDALDVWRVSQPTDATRFSDAPMQLSSTPAHTGNKRGIFEIAVAEGGARASGQGNGLSNEIHGSVSVSYVSNMHSFQQGFSHFVTCRSLHLCLRELAHDHQHATRTASTDSFQFSSINLACNRPVEHSARVSFSLELSLSLLCHSRCLFYLSLSVERAKDGGRGERK